MGPEMAANYLWSALREAKDESSAPPLIRLRRTTRRAHQNRSERRDRSVLLVHATREETFLVNSRSNLVKQITISVSPIISAFCPHIVELASEQEAARRRNLFTSGVKEEVSSAGLALLARVGFALISARLLKAVHRRCSTEFEFEGRPKHSRHSLFARLMRFDSR